MTTQAKTVANTEATAATATPAVEAAPVKSKADLAIEIFNREVVRKIQSNEAPTARKDVLKMFEEVGLAAAAAATYYQNFRKQAGLTAKK